VWYSKTRCEVVGNGFSSDCVPQLVGTFGLRGAWEWAGAQREREREREEEAAWRSSQISTMLPLTSQLSGKNLELQLLVSMMLTGSHLCLENTPVWNLKKKLIEWDREFGFLICWGVFFFCVQGASTERSGSYSWFRKCLFWSLWFSFLVRFGLLGFWRSKQWWSVCCVGNLFVSDIDLAWRMRGSYRGWDLGQVAMMQFAKAWDVGMDFLVIQD
jgi:hypothetical protein